MMCTIVLCVDVMKCGGWCRSALLCHVIFSHDRIGRESPACCAYSIYVGCSPPRVEWAGRGAERMWRRFRVLIKL